MTTGVGLGRSSRQLRTGGVDRDFFSGAQVPHKRDQADEGLVSIERRQSNSGLKSKTSTREEASAAQNAASDERFSRFYNSLEGFISRIGSPLAGPLGFAGMDLVVEGGDAGDIEEAVSAGAASGVESYGYGVGYGVTDMVNNLVPKGWWGGGNLQQPAVKVQKPKASRGRVEELAGISRGPQPVNAAHPIAGNASDSFYVSSNYYS